ncbi:hypothetical protein FEE96_04980 [Parasedimentitalea maritima]|uniref:Uncharacterized protein n=1 Tax=Parasedimentitalea maritima TaxID=2578117 RepID=A0ABY2UZC1_9RHOB|nr:hypothetical protein [Zongyanglinia marina]TLP67881.1 hypothetical protein FEE96_04980 [Zongyanglinia marina]
MTTSYSIPSVLRLGIIGALLGIGSGTAADTIDWKTVGGWDVSFYPSSEGCQAFSLFEEDTAFFIGFDNTGGNLSLDITLLDNRWRSIENGSEYSITAKFGNESPWTLAMDGIQVDGFPGLNMLIDANSDQAGLFIDEFQRKGSITWSFGSSPLGRYTLRGSRKAFNEVVACQRSYLEALNGSSDPFATSDPFRKKGQ